MGIDLYLLPFNPDANFSHTILQVNRRRDLWPKIMKLEQYKVPKQFYSYLGNREGVEGRCYGPTLETPYGQVLMYVLNKDLLTLSHQPGVQDCWDNRAIWAFLKECPPNMHVALYWH